MRRWIERAHRRLLKGRFRSEGILGTRGTWTRSRGEMVKLEGTVKDLEKALQAPQFSRETNGKMEWKMEIFTISGNFWHFSEFFSHFFTKSRDSLSFPNHFCEIPAKFHQIFAEKSRNSSKNENGKWNFIFIPAKNWTVFR